MRFDLHFIAPIFTLALLAVPAARAGACSAQVGGGTAQTLNNWVVNSDQTVENQTIHLKGPLEIMKGTLTLRGVALEIDSAQFSAITPSAVLAIQVNIQTGGSLAISGSKITATSASTGVIETLGTPGATPTSVTVDHTCLSHIGAYLSDLTVARFNQNEFIYGAGENFGAPVMLMRTSHAQVDDNVVQSQDGVTPPGIGGFNLNYVHDSEVLRNTLTWTATGFGLFSSWNNHVAENTWLGAAQSAGFNSQAADWWSLGIVGRVGTGGIGIEGLSNNNLIEKNTFMGAHSGIFTIKDSSNNRITQNTIAGAGYGFTVRGGSGNVIDGNEISDVWDDGVQVFRSHDNLFTNNHIYNSGRGISLYASDNNAVKSNAIADSDRGIFVHESAKNTIGGNTISGAFEGIFVASNSNGNSVTGNNIVTSDQPAWDDGPSNNWKGNYWGKAPAAKWAIAGGSASDSGPAAAMFAPVPAVVPPFAPPPFAGPADTAITIQGQEVWQGARTVNGSIGIPSGGSLTLRGATLTYTYSQNPATIRIYVAPGGSLTIEDSRIIGPRWDMTFEIQVQPGGNLSMKRSEIDNAGDWVGQSAAIATYADNTDIEDSTFVNVYCALSAEGARVRNLRFINNTVIGAVKAIALSAGTEDGAVVTGNRISRYGMWGFDFDASGTVMLGNAADSHLTDNTFSDAWGEAIHVQWNGPGLEIARNTCVSIKGPCQLIDTGGIDVNQLRMLSSSASAAQPGDPLSAAVRIGSIMSPLGYYPTEERVYSAALTSNGSPVQERDTALSLGSFARIPLAGTAAAAGQYDITVDLMGCKDWPGGQGSCVAVSKPELRFAVQPGSTAPPQVFRAVYLVYGNNPWVWTACSDSPWLHVTPGAGAGNSELTVNVDSKNLAPGVYTGKIQVSTDGTAPQFVSVTLTVTGDLPILVANPATLSFSDTSAPKTVALSLAQATFSLPFAVAIRTDLGGNWLSATADGNTTPATLTVSVNSAGLAPGQYVGEVTISAAGAGNGPLSIPVTLTVAGSAANIISVVNGASFEAGIAAESWVTITGTNLSRTTRTWGPDDFVQGRLPTSLEGVRVYINTVPAYVYFVSPTQLNVLASFNSAMPADPSTAPVEVDTPDGTASTTTLLRHAAPGVFVFGGQNAAAVHADGSPVCAQGSIAGAACRPAAVGETIELFVTGLGTNLSPLPPDGFMLTSPSIVRDPATVTLGGAPCTVLFQGMVEPGSYQINLQIPNIAGGDQPLVVSVAGTASQAGPILTVAGAQQ